VTLKNDVYSPLRSIFTDGSGRFKFTGTAGAYYIEVDPLEKPFLRTEQRFELQSTPFSKLGEVFFIDIVLKPRENAENKPSAEPGVVFYQDVPPAARTEYDRGVSLLEKNPDGAYDALRKALQLFPDYYAAMETLGGAYVKAGHLDYALPLLLHAVEVNPSGTKSYYALGVVFYNKESYKNAVKAFNRVLKDDTKNANALIYVGLSLMRDGQEAEAEQSLKKAYPLGEKNVPDVQLALASIYTKQKRYNEAVGELQRLLKENPDMKDRVKIEERIRALQSKKTDAQPSAKS
jgi:cytochrome c-type biogenesis protein CcmH/NrfG